MKMRIATGQTQTKPGAVATTNINALKDHPYANSIPQIINAITNAIASFLTSSQ